ncbi:MAG: hypothetical protein ACP5HM_00385 [Anaerolineae bacterium]
MADYKTLIQQHRMLRWRYGGQPLAVKQEEIQELVDQVGQARKEISDPEQRKTLEEIERYWRSQLRPTHQHMPLWAVIGGGVLLIIVVAVGIAYILAQGIDRPAAPPPTATDVAATEAPEMGATTPEGTVATDESPPTASPTSTPPPATPTPTPTPAPEETPLVDVVADVAPLAGGAVLNAPPEGIDIATCNVITDATVLTTLAPPATLSNVEVTTETLTVWLSLQTATPAERALLYHWLVALDTDGNTTTGRPPGDGYINPDLGQEVGAGLFLYPDGTLEPYVYIWSPTLGDWDGNTPDIVDITVSETRNAVAFTFPLEELRTQLAQIAGSELNLQTLKGRLATIASSQTQAALVDYCPDLP